LDIGCGQGRNTIPLCEMGFKVTGLDSCKTGLEQIMEVKSSLDNPPILINLPVEKFDRFGEFDAILFDRFFHCMENNLDQEVKILSLVASMITSDCKIVCLVGANSGQEKILKDLFDQNNLSVEFENEIVEASDNPYLSIENRSFLILGKKQG
jgi:hypothetical protein